MSAIREVSLSTMIDTIPFHPLGTFPTPVERLTSLEQALGLHSLWIKRDDRSGPLGGGNKIRKLEYMFAAAHAAATDNTKQTLLTLGPTGSNHVRATALYGKKAGFNVECILFKQPPTEYADANEHAIRKNASRIYECQRPETAFARYCYERLKTGLGIGADRYFIAMGGSSPLGSVGYVKAALELKTQIDAGLLPEPRFIFVPVGTCGTIAGLIVGARLAGLQTQIVGVRVTERLVANTWAIAHLVRRTLRLIGAVDASDINPRRIELWHGDFGNGYALPTEASARAVAMLAHHEGLTLENTYTGKAFAGLVHYLKAHGCEAEHTLFWHTYGTS